MNQNPNSITPTTREPIGDRRRMASCRVWRFPVGVILIAGLAAPGPSAQSDCVGFQEHSIMSGGTNGVASVHAVDLDGDLDIDIIAASSNDDTIAWFRSNGATPPVFDRRVIATDADGVTSVHAADVDGDGDVDVLAASANNNTIAMYENIGLGAARTFVRMVISSSARRAQSVFAADVDRDGDIDILSASFTDNTIAWYENPRITNMPLNPDGPSFGFTRRIVSTTAINASAVYAADVDGDGDVDVLSASVGDDKIAWYEAGDIETDDNGAVFLAFTEHVVATDADGARSVFAANLDATILPNGSVDPAGDTDVDVLSASISDDTVAWYENKPGATPPFAKHVISSTARGAKSVFAADLDADGDQDVIVAAARDNAIYWYENLPPAKGAAGPPRSFAPRTIALNVESADAVFAIDLDQDDQIDVLSAASVPGSVSVNDELAWYKNDLTGPTPVWPPTVVASTAEGLNALFLADIDLDGEQDLVAATTTDKIVWYRITDDQGVPVFDPQPVAEGVPDARSVFAHDLDGDGDQDIISASAGDDTIRWHVNPLNSPGLKSRNSAADADDVKGGFEPLLFATPIVVTGDADTVESVFVADINGDGNPDILSASSGDDSIAWYNRCNEVGGGCADPPEFVKTLLSSQDLDLVPFRTAAARSVYAVDLDGDLDLDVLSASSGDDRITWFENQLDTEGTFTPFPIAAADMNESVFVEGGAFAVSATDLDKDGNVDVLVAASSAGRINWYEHEFDVATGQRTFTQRVIDPFAPIAVFVGFADVDGDLDDDVLATTLGNNRVLWYENHYQAPEPGDETDPNDPLLFTRHVVNFDGVNPRSIVALDLDHDGAEDIDMDGDLDGDTDLIAGFRFSSSWFEQTGELCVNFDVTPKDGVMNGLELAYIGRAFGMRCDEAAEVWVCEVDYNRDGEIDGLDLAILSSPGVWGESTAVVDGVPECSYTCQ